MNSQTTRPGGVKPTFERPENRQARKIILSFLGSASKIQPMHSSARSPKIYRKSWPNLLSVHRRFWHFVVCSGFFPIMRQPVAWLPRSMWPMSLSIYLTSPSRLPLSGLMWKRCVIGSVWLAIVQPVVCSQSLMNIFMCSKDNTPIPAARFLSYLPR